MGCPVCNNDSMIFDKDYNNGRWMFAIPKDKQLSGFTHIAIPICPDCKTDLGELELIKKES